MHASTPRQLLLLLAVWGCAEVRPQSERGQGQAATCPPQVWEHFGRGGVEPPSRQSTYIASITPPTAHAILDTIFYADTVDLNCDGRTDYLAHGRARTDWETPRALLLIVEVRGANGWRRVLVSNSPVRGVEVAAIAADLTGGGRRDLVTVGSDEGGYVPRVFRWREEQYVPVAVPGKYVLRHETDWGAACRQRINPRWVGRGRISLLRETISPASAEGHGADCDLPVDTVQIAGDSLVSVRP